MGTTSPKQADMRHAEIACVAALPIEIAPLVAKCEKVKKYSGGDFTFRGGMYRGLRLAFVETGTGGTRAGRGAKAMIEGHSPEWVLSVGFSGGMIPQMRPGDIVVANEIVDQHGNDLKIDLRMQEDRERGLFVGRILMADGIARTVAEKKELHERTGALAVDMESLAVARACQAAGTKFMAIRVVSDDMTADLPPEILTILGTTGNVRLGATLGAVWNRPESVKDLWNLRSRANSVAERLAGFLDTVLEQLAQTLS